MPCELLWTLAGGAGFVVVIGVSWQAWRRRRSIGGLLRRLIKWWLYDWWEYDRK